MRSFSTRLAVSPERARRMLALAMALIVGVGCALALRDGDRVKSLDEPAYLDLSANLAVHGVFAHTNRPDVEGFDPRLPVGALRPTAYRPPAYAWFQAPVRALGGGYRLLRAVNAVLLAGTLWLLFSLLVRRAGELAGVIGIVLVLLYPVLLYAAGTLYPQTLAALLLMASVWQLDRFERSSRLRDAGVVGVTIGALVLTVPVDLLLLPVVAGWMVWSRRVAPRQLAVMLLALAATVGPWMARNRLLLGGPAGIATSSGFNLLAGNGPYIRDARVTGALRWPKGVREQVAGKGEAERDRIMTAAALHWIRENPGEAASLYAEKLLSWFSFRNQLVSDRLVPGGSGAGPPWLRDLAMLLGYGFLTAVLLVRLGVARRLPLTPLEVLLLVLYVAAGMVYAVFFTRIRFRLPFDWLLIALDAMFLARVVGQGVSFDAPKTAGGEMGLLDRLFRGRQTPEATEARPPITGPEALARWRYLLVTAPPEALAAAHADGLARMDVDTQAGVLHRMRSALSALEPGAVSPRESEVLVRAAARAERRAPGFLERALSTDAAGRRSLDGLATLVVASSAAAPFLVGFQPGMGEDPLAERRAPDFEVDASGDGPGPTHDDELDDED